MKCLHVESNTLPRGINKVKRVEVKRGSASKHTSLFYQITFNPPLNQAYLWGTALYCRKGTIDENNRQIYYVRIQLSQICALIINSQDLFLSSEFKF